MSYGPVQVFTVSMASAVSQSTAINLGKSFSKVSLVVPSMASGTEFGFKVSDALAGTYQTFYHQPTVTSGAVSFSIASAVSKCVVPLPNLHVQYVKVFLASQTVDSAYQFSLICSD